MIDDRFYETRGPLPASALSLDAQLIGNAERLVSGVSPPTSARPDDLAYFDGEGPPPGEAGVVICRAAPAEPDATRAYIVTSRPRGHFATVASRLVAERPWPTATEHISAEAKLEPGVRLGPGVAIAPNARIGADTVIGPNAVIGPGVAIGRRCRIGAGVVISCALIGDDVTILPNASIGQAGFGVALDMPHPVDVPHFGRAVIQDGASIGANCTIDRGLFDDTVVGEHAKIDNLCHIAHNVVVGRAAVMAAFAGVSGSVKIGEGAVLAGRVGIADHRTIGDRAVLAACSAVMHDIPMGETWAGYPAKPIRQWLRETAWLGRAIGRRDGGKS